MFFVLSGGTEPFRSSTKRSRGSLAVAGFTVSKPNVELNLLAGETGLELAPICAEGKHLLPSLLARDPGHRAPLNDSVLQHPLFWTRDQKLQYLSEIAGLLPIQPQHPFIAEIEQLLDASLGPYDEAEPANGGSWSRAFNRTYPPSSGWGPSQRPPEPEEHDYYVKEIRSVGLLKFLQSVYAQRAQHVEALRFPSEPELCTWLLEPFPFLMMGVYEADQRHRLSSLFGGSHPAVAEPPAWGRPEATSPGGRPPAQEARPTAGGGAPQFDVALNPLSADGQATTDV